MSDVKFEDNSMKVKAAINDALIAALHEAAGAVKSAAIRNSRSDTGDTRGKWDYIVDESAMEATVGNPLENAIWEEFGTGEFAIEGNGRKGAWYVPVEKVTGKKKPTYNGKVIVINGKNGQKYYKTNGKKPNRTLERAFNQKKAAIEKMFERKMKELNDEH